MKSDRTISMLPLGPPLDDFQLRLEGKISAEEYVRRLDERVRQRREEMERHAASAPIDAATSSSKGQRNE